jgi:hypothetical protein
VGQKSVMPANAQHVRSSLDCVAKVPNCRAIIFPPKDETSRDRRLIWRQAR